MSNTQTFETVTDQAQNLSENMCHKAGEAMDTVQSEAKKYMDLAQDYIQKSPLKALGIVAAAGAVLAMVIRK